ncbi:MAG: EAL domain-containing response regulator [Myxococcota bacterium]|nr:EAL domain-containing response regulator [Myxococcota bacterium]
MSRILMVDDDLPLLRILRKLLLREGHDVFTADSGLEALQIADNERLDVAIIDQYMPGLTGMEVMQRLQHLQPGCVRILASGQLDIPIIIHAINHGEVDRVLQKPFSHERLRCVIDDALASRAKKQLALTEEVRLKRESDRAHLETCLPDITLALQPILRPDLTLFGFEGLLRSQHPVLSNPLKVIKAAENCDMFHAVSDQVMKIAGKWHTRLPPINLFINLHPDELLNPDALMASLKPLLPYASRTVLEITEHNQIQHNSAWEASIEGIRERGFRIAVDDLGAGYNSLSVLATLQPEFIKIDMSIVRDVDTDTYKQRLIRILAQLGEGTNATVLAEGVETAAELEKLLECGVHLVQGYHLGKPTAEADLSRYNPEDSSRVISAA